MASRFTLSIRDYSNEMSTMSVPGLTLSAANFDAQDGLWDDLQDAVDGIIVGVIGDRKLLAQDIEVSVDLPTNAFAQRELKWLVRWSGDNSGLHTTEIPTPDATLTLAGTDNLNIGSGAGQTFADAFEAVVRGEGDTAVTVQNVILVGRTL